MNNNKIDIRGNIKIKRPFIEGEVIKRLLFKCAGNFPVEVKVGTYIIECDQHYN